MQNKRRRICWWLIGGIFILLFSGCEKGSAQVSTINPPIGQSCVIQFRRDALGAAANLPVSPKTSSINGAETSMSGTLKAVTAEWLVLSQGLDLYWIPRNVVLSVKYRADAKIKELLGDDWPEPIEP